MNEAGSENSNCEANSNGAVDSASVLLCYLRCISKMGSLFIMQIPMSGISAFFTLFYASWNVVR
jgi:hypothetical protein